MARTASGGCERRRLRRPELGPSQSAAPGPGRLLPARAAAPARTPAATDAAERAQRNARPLGPAWPCAARSRGAEVSAGAGPRLPARAVGTRNNGGPVGTRPGPLALCGLVQRVGPGGPGLRAPDPTKETPGAGGWKGILASTRGLGGLIFRIFVAGEGSRGGAET